MKRTNAIRTRKARYREVTRLENDLKWTKQYTVVERMEIQRQLELYRRQWQPLVDLVAQLEQRIAALEAK